MNEAVLADIEIARSSAATPVVLASLRDVVLEVVQAGERLLPQRHYFFENLLLALTEGLELAIAVMNNTHRGGESQGRSRDAPLAEHLPDCTPRCPTRN